MEYRKWTIKMYGDWFYIVEPDGAEHRDEYLADVEAAETRIDEIIFMRVHQRGTL